MGGLLGVAVGDALGVPVEFMTRQELRREPVKKMIGYGSHSQPPGTWSDDASLTFCQAESLCEAGFDLADTARRFVRWEREGYWTPHGVVFDVGGTTKDAILRLENGVFPELAGLSGERSNGNGSLMRILPASVYLAGSGEKNMLDCIRRISSITHAHLRSVLACVIYTLMVWELLDGGTPRSAYDNLTAKAPKACRGTALVRELPHFQRILTGELQGLDESRINSDGYVVSTLEASIWCLLQYDNFSDTVLAAVNLGSDSDTTGAVAGGLAGIAYGLDSIPPDWLEDLARYEDITALARRFAAACQAK